MCKEPLAPILCRIFQQSPDEAYIRVPATWKTSEIILIPEKSPPTCQNDYRPLTSVIMKCLEKIVKDILLE